MADGWCTIESDPGVFTELLSAFQVKDVQLDELYSLDDDTLASMGKIHGLIFLFKWQKPPEGAAPPTISEDPTIYFANQTVNNACATQALIQIMLNKEEIEIGPELSMLREFTAEMPADMRGEAISNSESIRAAHNSFSHQGFVSIEDPNEKKDGDAFHFVGYIEKNGRLIELDGLQRGPIDHGEIGAAGWLPKAREVMEKRMGEYTAGADGKTEIRFNLMAMVKERRSAYREEIAALQSGGGDDGMVAAQVQQLQGQIAEEDAKHARWQVENQRRRHNWIPLCVELMKIMAKQGKLEGAIADAKQKKAAAAAPAHGHGHGHGGAPKEDHHHGHGHDADGNCEGGHAHGGHGHGHGHGA